MPSDTGSIEPSDNIPESFRVSRVGSGISSCHERKTGADAVTAWPPVGSRPGFAALYARMGEMFYAYAAGFILNLITWVLPTPAEGETPAGIKPRVSHDYLGTYELNY